MIKAIAPPTKAVISWGSCIALATAGGTLTKKATY